MLDTSARVAVVGGGAVGTSTLFHLAEHHDVTGVLFEKGQLGSGSTSKAAGGVRNTFTTPINVEIGNQAIEFFEHFERHVGEPLDFRQNGYMYLFHTDERERHWRDLADFLRGNGVTAQILSAEEAAATFPGLDASAIQGALYGPDCGHVDPHSLTQGFARAAVDRGATIHTKTAVTDIVVEDGSVTAVETEDGRYAVDAVVNAAGPWASGVGAMVGVDLPLSFFLRRIMVTSPLDGARGPLVIDPELECYVEAERNGSLLVCDTAQDVHDIDDIDAAAGGTVGYDYYLKTTEKVERLLPALADLDVVNGWGGVQSHTDDGHAILGPTDVDGFFVACGFSGHGVQQSPIVGAALADLLATGQTDRFDVDRLSLDRFGRSDRLDPEGMA